MGAGVTANSAADMRMRSALLLLVSAILMLHTAAGDNCNIVCGRDYNPVCGKSTEGSARTFSNLCMMHYYNCQKGADFAVGQKGECDGQK